MHLPLPFLFFGGLAFAASIDGAFQARDFSPLRKRAECGPGIGSCNPGDCCSEAGWCGKTEDYCGGSSCQLDYSDSCDTFFPPPGASTESVARPHIGSVPYGSIINDCATPGTLALTFDDGPYIYTSQILDVLDSFGVKATFFVAGNNLGKKRIDDPTTPWPAVMARMYAAGHHIASHSWTHRSLDQVNSTIQKTEIIYNEMAFRNLFGWIPTYFRSPYLECSVSTGCQNLLKTLGYHIVHVNIDTKDYMYDTAALIQNAKDRFSNGVSTNAAVNDYIELSHDVHYQTVVNLTAFMINTSRARGYRLVTVGECLNDPPSNWYRAAGGSITTASSRASTSTTSSRISTSTSSTSSRISSTVSSRASTSTASSSTRSSSRACGAPPPSSSEASSLSSLSSTSSTRTSTSSSARPSSSLVVSPNQSCGGTTGYTCLNSQFGNCCSYYGFCGSSLTYCGTGCQTGFGSCSPPSTGVSDTTNGLCGSAWQATCKNYGDKKCCSASGFCGSTAAYCGSGCQSAFGICN